MEDLRQQGAPHPWSPPGALRRATLVRIMEFYPGGSPIPMARC
jgi:hypothetical protein